MNYWQDIIRRVHHLIRPLSKRGMTKHAYLGIVFNISCAHRMGSMQMVVRHHDLLSCSRTCRHPQQLQVAAEVGRSISRVAHMAPPVLRQEMSCHHAVHLRYQYQQGLRQ